MCSGKVGCIMISPSWISCSSYSLPVAGLWIGMRHNCDQESRWESLLTKVGFWKVLPLWKNEQNKENHCFQLAAFFLTGSDTWGYGDHLGATREMLRKPLRRQPRKSYCHWVVEQSLNLLLPHWLSWEIIKYLLCLSNYYGSFYWQLKAPLPDMGEVARVHSME